MSHRLVVGGKRNGKDYIGVSLAETYAMRGEHVHYHPKTCYNNGTACKKFVQQCLEWKEGRFVAAVDGETT